MSHRRTGWLPIGLLAVFAKRRADARKRYIRFVADGKGVYSIWIHLNNQVFLGEDAIVTKSLRRRKVKDDLSVPKAQSRPPPGSLDAIESRHRSRDAAIIAAHATGG